MGQFSEDKKTKSQACWNICLGPLLKWREVLSLATWTMEVPYKCPCTLKSLLIQVLGLSVSESWKFSLDDRVCFHLEAAGEAPLQILIHYTHHFEADLCIQLKSVMLHLKSAYNIRITFINLKFTYFTKWADKLF